MLQVQGWLELRSGCAQSLIKWVSWVVPCPCCKHMYSVQWQRLHCFVTRGTGIATAALLCWLGHGCAFSFVRGVNLMDMQQLLADPLLELRPVGQLVPSQL